MRRKVSVGNSRASVPPDAVVCERVLRYLRLVGYGRDGQRVHIHAWKDHGTHWKFTFAVPSIEDPSRIFMYGYIVVEKETGFIYTFPSRVWQPIDTADIASIRQGCRRITPADLDQLEAEVRARMKGVATRRGSKQRRY